MVVEGRCISAGTRGLTCRVFRQATLGHSGDKQLQDRRLAANIIAIACSCLPRRLFPKQCSAHRQGHAQEPGSPRCPASRPPRCRHKLCRSRCGEASKGTECCEGGTFAEIALQNLEQACGQQAENVPNHKASDAPAVWPLQGHHPANTQCRKGRHRHVCLRKSLAGAGRQEVCANARWWPQRATQLLHAAPSASRPGKPATAMGRARRACGGNGPCGTNGSMASVIGAKRAAKSARLAAASLLRRTRAAAQAARA